MRLSCCETESLNADLLLVTSVDSRGVAVSVRSDRLFSSIFFSIVKIKVLQQGARKNHKRQQLVGPRQQMELANGRPVAKENATRPFGVKRRNGLGVNVREVNVAKRNIVERRAVRGGQADRQQTALVAFLVAGVDKWKREKRLKFLHRCQVANNTSRHRVRCEEQRRNVFQMQERIAEQFEVRNQ